MSEFGNRAVTAMLPNLIKIKIVCLICHLSISQNYWFKRFFYRFHFMTLKLRAGCSLSTVFFLQMCFFTLPVVPAGVIDLPSVGYCVNSDVDALT